MVGTRTFASAASPRATETTKPSRGPAPAPAPCSAAVKTASGACATSGTPLRTLFPENCGTLVTLDLNRLSAVLLPILVPECLIYLFQTIPYICTYIRVLRELYTKNKSILKTAPRMAYNDMAIGPFRHSFC